MKKLGRYSLKYYYIKLLKHPGTPEYIARGVFVGAFVGLFMPAGGQIIAAIALCFVFKGAKIPAILMTCTSNNFTIPILYPLQCYVGGYLIGSPFSYAYIKDLLIEVIKEQSYSKLGSLGWELVVSFFAGGALFGIILAIPSYFAALYLVRKYREQKALRQLRKQRFRQTQ